MRSGSVSTSDVPRLIICIKGGVIQEIITDQPVRIWYIDWDDINEDEQDAEEWIPMVMPITIARNYNVAGTWSSPDNDEPTDLEYDRVEIQQALEKLHG